MTQLKTPDDAKRVRVSTGSRITRRVLAGIALWLAATVVITTVVPPPTAVGIAGAPRVATEFSVLTDDSWLNAAGERELEQSIFDSLFASIERAQRYIYLDLFLFNDWQGPIPETTRALSAELTAQLVAATQRTPAPRIVLITDPINTVYGGIGSPHLQQLRAAGVEVALTDLVQLQDSNPLWSSLWRWLIRPFGNTEGLETVPNPMTTGRVSIRSWLALLNFKANHRKLAVFDDPERDALVAMVMSANPHDGSSAHRNMAFRVSGPVVHDLLQAERQVPGMAAQPAAQQIVDDMISLAAEETPESINDRIGEAVNDGQTTVSLVNESAIRSVVVDTVNSAQAGDAVNLEMFYLSDRQVVTALGDAAHRGVVVRALLDVNSDAFGRAKNGVPNVPVAHELTQAGVTVRWCATAGEQCHVKWFHARIGERHSVVSGSGNFTRRNLADFNLESNLLLRTHADDANLQQMLTRFERQWRNEPGRTYSIPYADNAKNSLWLSAQYRFMEATGLGTF